MARRVSRLHAARDALVGGFSLLELTVVLVVLGILAATALPRFMDSRVEAHEATVRAVGYAFATAVTMVHAQWRVNGATPSADDVTGFADGSVDVSANGWPTDTQGANLIVTGETGRQRCARLFRTLLLNGPAVTMPQVPNLDQIGSAHAFSIAPRDPAADFWASAPTIDQCRFAYQPLPNMSISYSCLTGQVVVDADSSS